MFYPVTQYVYCLLPTCYRRMWWKSQRSAVSAARPVAARAPLHCERQKIWRATSWKHKLRLLLSWWETPHNLPISDMNMQFWVISFEQFNSNNVRVTVYEARCGLLILLFLLCRVPQRNMSLLLEIKTAICRMHLSGMTKTSPANKSIANIIFLWH